MLPPEPHPRQAQGGPRRRPAPRPLKPTTRSDPRFPPRLQTSETRRPLQSAATLSTQRSSAPAEASAAALVYARPPTPAACRAPRRRHRPARCARRWLVGSASEAPQAPVRALGAEPPPRPRDRARARPGPHAPRPGPPALTVPAARRLEGHTGEATVELQTEGGYQNVYIWGARGGAGDCIAWH